MTVHAKVTLTVCVLWTLWQGGGSALRTPAKVAFKWVTRESWLPFQLSAAVGVQGESTEKGWFEEL